MGTKKLAVHEMVEIHELLAFKNACAAKSSVMKELASESALKSLIESDIRQTKTQIKDLQKILTSVTLSTNTIQ